MNRAYPIVSQEVGVIHGFRDDENDLFRIRKPLVVFGDHTRVSHQIIF